MNNLRLLVFLFLTFAPYYCFAQRQSNWDETLDRYEVICERCLELKRNREAGQSVPKESISSLKTQLIMLRNSLLQVQGQMSAAQKARFNMIRQRFGDVPTIREPENPPVPKQERTQGKERTSTAQAFPVPEPERAELSPAPSVKALETTLAAGTPKFSVSTVCELKKSDFNIPSPTKRGPEFLFGVQVGLCPLQSYGIMVGILPNPGNDVRVGAYVKALSDFKFKNISPAYTCKSDGTVEDGKKIWTNGATESRRFSFCAGGMVRFGSYIGVYAGVGYGDTRYFLQDVNDVWAKVSDLSHSGLCVEAGVTGFLGKHFYVGAGISATSFRYLEPQVTFGYRLAQ